MKTTVGCWTLALALSVVSATASGEAVLESEREIPVAAEVDVLVVGGTAAGVAAATAAAQAGASVFLAGGFPYLGEDVAGTLELECAAGDDATPLERRLRRAEQALAPYAYEQKPGFKYVGGYQYVCDKYEKFSTTASPKCPWDSVLYTNAAAVTCTLERQEKIASVEVLVFENDDPNAEAALSVDHRGIIPPGKRGPLTGGVRLVFLDGPRAGETLPLVRGERHEPILGIVIRDVECTTQHTTTFSAPVDAEVHRVRVEVDPADDAACHLVSRIRFRRPDSVRFEENPSPLVVKRTLDRELIEAGVRFITASPVTDLVVDEDGCVAGAVFANRNGRQAVIAKSVIDATRYATLSHLGRPLPGVGGGTARFTRVIQAGAVPQGVRATAFDAPRHATHHPTEWPRLFRCELELPLADGSYRSFARAEVLARELTWEKTTMDDADLLRPVGFKWPQAKRLHLRTLPDEGSLGERIRRGAQVGADAAADAKRRGRLSDCFVGAATVEGDRTLEIREMLGGLRPYALGRSRRTIVSTVHDVPVLGEFDVVVVGGGTAGLPAAISSGRAGAKTLVVEYLHTLGGVASDGMVLGYYAGNHVGFTKEFQQGEKTFGAETYVYNRVGTWRRMIREAGVEVWYGTMCAGAVTDGDKVAGVVVVTPFGRGIVRAKSVIDATGNADVAAAAGAKTEFLGASELAVQSAGQAPHRLGRGAGNSDFGLVNDTDALDLWLFGVRARAGAPDAWDVQQLVDSRERRRIVSDYAVTGWDVVADRTFADTISVACSKQDGHGYFSDEFGCIAPDDGLVKRFVNVPLRSLLPRGLSGLAVIGLGKGVARDVVPFTRMQADLFNEGYGAGLCAAVAAKETDGDYRRIDIRRVQRRLVEKGTLPEAALTWKNDVTVPTDDEIRALVASFKDGYRGSEKLYVVRERARPFLCEAYAKATEPGDRQAYAVLLGLMGDATGAETLAALMDDRQPVKLRKKYSYGRSMDVIGVAVAAGRTKAKAVEEPIRRRIARLKADSTITQFRMATLAAEAYAAPALAEALADALERPGVGGWARTKAEELEPMGGYGVGPEIDRCTKELALARALWACGDCRGLAQRTLEAYAADPRGIYAEHAAAVLRTRPQPPAAPKVELPGEACTNVAIGCAPFPDRMSAYVWRNWFVVPHARLAAAVGAEEADLEEVAAQMGLPKRVDVPPEWRRKGYITILRRNWHLLDYPQLMKVVDMTREELRFSLLEDDFLYVKLGNLKPKCGELRWRAGMREENRAARQGIAQVLREEGVDDFSEEPRFKFVRDIAAVSPEAETRREAADSPFDFRMIFSYFADYCDPLWDNEIGSYPEGLLQKLSAQGVNAVWLHTVLRTLVKDPKYPEFGEGSERRIANLRTLVKRCEKYGIKVFLYMNEPRAMPDSFFRGHAEREAFRGCGDRNWPVFAMCTSCPDVRRWVRDSLEQVFRGVPGLGGIFTITMSENLTNCASRGNQRKCPRCAGRSASEIVAEINAAMIEGMAAGNPDATALLYDWAWDRTDGGKEKVMSLLPRRNVRVLSVSEHAMPICRGGVDVKVGDYSISVVGPGEDAKRTWAAAKANGLPTTAKVQANCSWEIAAFPYLPVMDLVAEHAHNLVREGVDGVVLSWSHGCCPAPNLSVFRDVRKTDADKGAVLDRLAAGLYGQEAVAAVRKAWTAFADGYRAFPFSVSVAYSGPQHMGPANPLYLEPTGYAATMVGLPYDSVKRWCAQYPAETWVRLMSAVRDGFERGCAAFAEAIALMPEAKRAAAERELAMFRAETLHFRSCVDQVGFYRARDAKDSDAMRAFAEKELRTAKEMLPLVRADSSFGYESSNQYFYIPQDIREKVLTCRAALER